MKAYITRLAYYLPEIVEENEEIRLRKKTGIERRHICPDDMTAADMVVFAAEKIFSDEFPREAVDFLLYCTQSPDYPLPSTACILQNRLGLPKHCGALDFDLGCSGYVYGLGLAKGLIESGQAKNVLLLTSETYTKYIHSEDHAVRPLFGDAATATIISAIDTDKPGIDGLVYGTDGSGADKLMVPVGGMRQRYQTTPVTETKDKYGNVRTNQNLFMDGGAIMDFALDVVPETVNQILAKTGLKKEEIDYYVFHQANKFMLKSLQMLCGLTGMPYWNDCAEYGNTVSNSIPIALVDMMKANQDTKQDESQDSKQDNKLSKNQDTNQVKTSTAGVQKDNSLKNVMLVGFGVGLSWGGCVIDLREIKD